MHNLKEQISIFSLVLINFFAPIGLTFLAVGCFVMLDTFLGFYKSKLIKQNTSKKLRLGIVPKTLFYFLFIGAVFIMDMAFMNDFVKLFFQWNLATTKLAGFILIWIEATSIGENFKEIKGVSIMDYVRSFFRNGKEIFKNINQMKKNDEH